MANRVGQRQLRQVSMSRRATPLPVINCRDLLVLLARHCPLAENPAASVAPNTSEHVASRDTAYGVRRRCRQVSLARHCLLANEPSASVAPSDESGSLTSFESG